MRLRFILRFVAIAPLLLAVLPLHVHANVPRSGPRSGPPPLRRQHLGALTPLGGSLLPRLRTARRLTALRASTRLEVDVALKVRDEAGLRQFLHDIYDPHSLLYHHFLTTREFAERFAPRSSDRAVVASWLTAHGLRVVETQRNGLLIRTTGTAGAASRAFGTRLYTYMRGHDHFFANASPLRVPRAFTSIVQGVMGLDNQGHMRPAGIHRLLRPRIRTHASVDGYSPSDLQGAYDMGPLVGAGLNGLGQTIAVGEFADFADADIRSYDARFGISATVPQHVSVPYNGQTGKTGDDGQSEVELDIEVVHALAPQARLLVYVSPNGKGAGLVQANRIVSDNEAKVISNSWGLPESLSSNGNVKSLDQIAMEAAAQGQAILAASGDSGAYDANGDFSLGDPRNHDLVVDYPSSDPWVTAVGGTTLTISGSSYGREAVWSNQSDGSGSGGGLSTDFGRPDWQQGPGVDNSYSNGARQTPDVAADADPRTGYAIYTQSDGKTDWYTFGGTSAASPFWAAYISLVQQYTNADIGFLNPTLYALGQRAGTFSYPPFHDVTAGGNLHYPATPGWDYGTGWGSMDGTGFLNALVSMGGPVTSRPTGTVTLPPTPQPQPQPSETTSFRVVVHWEKSGSTGGLNAPSLASSPKGKKVRLGLYLDVQSGSPGAAVAATFTILFKGKAVATSTQTGTLDATTPTGVYTIAQSYTPKKKGTYTFLGKVTMGGQTVARTATLAVK